MTEPELDKICQAALGLAPKISTIGFMLKRFWFLPYENFITRLVEKSRFLGCQKSIFWLEKSLKSRFWRPKCRFKSIKKTH